VTQTAEQVGRPTQLFVFKQRPRKRIVFGQLPERPKPGTLIFRSDDGLVVRDAGDRQLVGDCLIGRIIYRSGRFSFRTDASRDRYTARTWSFDYETE